MIDSRITYSCFRLVVRKERRGLSLRGRLVLVLVVLAIGVAMFRALYSFLAVSAPKGTGVMVVEGWIDIGALPQVAREYTRGLYDTVVIADAVYDLPDKWESGRYRSDYWHQELARIGVPSSKLFLVTSNVVQKDRTYHMALAVRSWLETNGIPHFAVDAVTIGAHARRSRLLFSKAFGRETAIGVVALDVVEFDPQHWWRSSEGVREVLFEAVAYIYVRVFFHE